jgi:glycerate kinase
MKKCMVAFDSFKGSLSAVDACAVVAQELRSARAGAVITECPLADGGEGTVGALLSGLAGGMWCDCRVNGPLAEMMVDAGYAWFPEERMAALEMASAAGLPLLRPEQYNPMKTTTLGVGELIGRAVERGAQTILLGVGGSATMDCGIGAASALGWQFQDREGHSVRYGAEALLRVERIVPPAESLPCRVQVLCDVTNPLTGPRGAARVYGPQKGAAPDMIEKIESGMQRFAEQIRRQTGIEVQELAGAGAAGGLAAGAVAFMQGELVSGIQRVMRAVRFEERCADADWIITGEGRLDDQSVQGKVLSGVLDVARRTGAKVAVIAGEVTLDQQGLQKAGITCAVALRKPGMTVAYAMEHSPQLLREAVTRFHGSNIPMQSSHFH